MTPTRKLSDGNDMPLLGLGVWQVEPGRETEDSVRWALELGYRHMPGTVAARLRSDTW